MKFLKKEWFLLLIIGLIAAWSVKALAIPDFYTSHDGETHTARLANYNLALQEGQIPPQLAPTLFGGFGFPIFVFIYPLPYLVGSFFHRLGISYTDAAELTMASGQVLSAIFIYIFFKLELKKRIPAFLGALFFTLAPYRFLMIFVRGAFAESFAYIFVASSLVCIYQLSRSKKLRWVGVSALSLAGMLLSHQLVSVMFLPVLGLYWLTKWFYQKDKKSFFIRTIASIGIAGAIAAFIYLPAYFERSYLRFDDLISYTGEHFVTPWQLIRSPWAYGFSHPGVENDDMSFQIGLTHLVVVALTLCVLAWKFARLKKFGLKHFKKLGKDKNLVKLSVWLAVFAVSSLIMLEHPLNYEIWKHTPGLNYVDFPWRFIGVAVTAASLLTAYLVSRLKNNLLLVLFLVFFVFYANRNHMRINQSVGWGDDYFENYPATATWRNEFLPEQRKSNRWEGIEGDYRSLNGDMEIEEVVNKTSQVTLDVDASASAELLIHRMYFPGWTVYIDDQEQMLDEGTFSLFGAVDAETGTDYSSFFHIKVPEGEHRVSAVFEDTPIRRAGKIATVVGLLASLGLIVVPEKFVSKRVR